MLIKVKRGTNVASKTLAQGELGFATDVNKLYIGTANGKIVVGPQQWGDIDGKIEDQFDLMNYLDSKVQKPSEEGTDGQVLATDGQGDTRWITVQSGPDLNNYYTKSETDNRINAHHDTSKQDILTAGQNISIDNNVISGPTDLSQLSQDALHRVVTDTEKSTWNSKESTSNKVTVINSSSTDSQYPSAKSVYNLLDNNIVLQINRY